MNRKIISALLAAALGVLPASGFAAPTGSTGSGSTTATSYILLSGASGSSPVISGIPGGGYNLSVTGTFSGAVYTLMVSDAAGNMVAAGTVSAITTPTAPINVNLPANSKLQLVLTSGSPSGIYASLASVGGPLTLAPTSVSVNDGAGNTLFTTGNPGTVATQDMVPVTVASGNTGGAVLFDVDVTGYAGLAETIINAAGSSVVNQQSDDNVNWFTAGFTNQGTAGSTIASSGTYFIPKQHRFMRAIVSTYAGTGSVTGTAYKAAFSAFYMTNTQINPGTYTIGNIMRSISYTDAGPIAQASGTTYTAPGHYTATAVGTAQVWNSFSCVGHTDVAGATMKMQSSLDGTTYFDRGLFVSMATAATEYSLKSPLVYVYNRCAITMGGTNATALYLASVYGE